MAGGHCRLWPASREPIFGRMWLSRRNARILIGLCLMVLQAQLFAAASLGCRHAAESGSGGDAAGACPYHQAETGQAGDQGTGALLDCQKCALHCAVGMNGLVGTTLELVGSPARAVLEAPPRRHFYRFSPDSFLKPPTPFLL